MIFSSNRQAINIVTRALIFHDEHLLVTKWKQGYSFLIGGRVDHGEPLEIGLIREGQEETGCLVKNHKFVYFCEHFFKAKDKDYHEFGWYFQVELENFPCKLREII